MKLLYFDCSMGAAGDMITASLLSLYPHPEEILPRLNAIGIPGVTYTLLQGENCGISGLMMRVLIGDKEEKTLDVLDHEALAGLSPADTVPSGDAVHHDHHHAHTHQHEHGEPDHHGYHSHHHAHHNLSDIKAIVKNLHLTDAVKADVFAVYDALAEAESRAHQKPVSEIHFHEVGNLDAIADIAAACYLIHDLAPEKIMASPIHIGSGFVHCAHGILPVPAPATGYLLEGIPIYGGTIQGELCTPTGAAILKHFVQHFGPLPVMTTKAIGYGLGHKVYPVANVLRTLLGETGEKIRSLWHLTCQIDDMTGEEAAFAMEACRKKGALDAYMTPIYMKKSRPALALTVLCEETDKAALVRTLFAHTSTLGVREYPFLATKWSVPSTPFPLKGRKSVSNGLQAMGYREKRQNMRTCHSLPRLREFPSGRPGNGYRKLYGRCVRQQNNDLHQKAKKLRSKCSAAFCKNKTSSGTPAKNKWGLM